MAREKKPFSSFRCIFNPKKASDYSKCHGYMNIKLELNHVQFCLEDFSSNLLIDLAKLSTNSKRSDTKRHLIKPSFPPSLSHLIPTLYFVITIDNIMVFRSSLMSFEKDVLNELLNHLEKVTQQSDNHMKALQSSVPITIDYPLHQGKKKQSIDDIGLSLDPVKQLQFLKNHWVGQFDVYHPDSSIGCHLVVLDPSCEEAQDEIVQSHYIQAKNIPSMCNHREVLLFLFDLPYSPMMNTLNLESSINEFDTTRQCSVRFTLRFYTRYASFFRSLPAYALDSPNILQIDSRGYSKKMDQPSFIRLIGTTFTVDTPQHYLISSTLPLNNKFSQVMPSSIYKFDNDINSVFIRSSERLIKHQMIQHIIIQSQLSFDIIRLWSQYFYTFFYSIIHWDYPMFTLIILFGLGLLALPTLRYPLIFIYLAIVLLGMRSIELTTHFSDKSITQRIHELGMQSQTRRPKTFQSSNATTANDNDSTLQESSTNSLIKTLIQSALPKEADYLLYSFSIILSSLLPIIIYTHDILTWSQHTNEHYKSLCDIIHTQQSVNSVSPRVQRNSNSSLKSYKMSGFTHHSTQVTHYKKPPQLERNIYHSIIKLLFPSYTCFLTCLFFLIGFIGLLLSTNRIFSIISSSVFTILVTFILLHRLTPITSLYRIIVRGVTQLY